jgi:RNA polymerase sigma factor (sigma-70 family)
MHDHHPRVCNAAEPHQTINAADEPPPVPGATAPRHARASTLIETLVLAWQRTADPDCFRALATTVVPLVERSARCALRRHGILDPTACDEVLSLVLDHLRRLPGAPQGERTVAPFAAPSHLQPEAGDPGEAYILWLSRDRAHDVARSRRRHSRHAVLFSQLDRPVQHRVELSMAARQTSASQPLEDLCDRLRAAVEHLPQRERSVIELLLAGKSQTVIADMIHVCEGTVSRLRSRAIAALRDLLTD